MRLRLMLTLGSLPLLGMALPVAQAACTFTPGPGNDTYTCDSGTAPSLVDTGGDNRLVFLANGSGAITGNVTFGAGRDSIDMASGSIGSNANPGSGTEGNVDQGSGSDDFAMSDGVIKGNLNQGDGLDTFDMKGGWIKGTFDSGDYAKMDGGRIGNVNMRLDQNTFIMRGGSVDKNVITAFDKDYVEIFDGTIGSNISVSGGDDRVLVHGGQVGGDVLLSTGNDHFIWDGGQIGGRVDAGPGDDAALLKGLKPEVLAIVLDGGEGNDSLTFDASQAVGGARYVNWELMALNNGSQLALDDTLVLGDTNSTTGSFTIDASSTIRSRQGIIAAFGPGQRVTLNNAGTIDLGSGNDAQGRLTVQGDYTGNNGTLRLNSVLAGDGAASDRLVVSRGAIGGSTQLLINNLDGAGATTAQNGIQVVEARDGAVSTATAFVQTQTLSAGAYDYRLFKGGVTAGSENSWYLRSTLVAPPAPAPAPEPGEPVVIAPAATRLSRPRRRARSTCQHRCQAKACRCIVRKLRCMPQRHGAPRSSPARHWARSTSVRATSSCCRVTVPCLPVGARPMAARYVSNGAARSARAWMATCTASRWARTCMPGLATVVIASTSVSTSAMAVWTPTSKASPWPSRTAAWAT